MAKSPRFKLSLVYVVAWHLGVLKVQPGLRVERLETVYSRLPRGSPNSGQRRRWAWRAQLPSILDVPQKSHGEPLPNVDGAQSTITCKPSEGITISTAARDNLWTKALQANSKHLRASLPPSRTRTAGLQQTARSDEAGTYPAHPLSLSLSTYLGIYIYIYPRICLCV